MNKEEARKQIMFVKNNDYYYIVYNVVLALNVFECTSPSRLLKDWRKLQFLVPLASDGRYTSLLSNPAEQRSQKDKQLLSRLYSSGIATRSQISQVLYLLECKGIISVYKDIKNNNYDIHLNKDKLNNRFFSRDVFFNEMKNLTKIKELYKQVRTMKYETLLDKIFAENGIVLWHI